MLGEEECELLTPYIWCSLSQRVGGRISLYIVHILHLSPILYQKMKRKSLDGEFGTRNHVPCPSFPLWNCLALPKCSNRGPLCGVLLCTSPASTVDGLILASKCMGLGTIVWDWKFIFTEHQSHALQ